ncbi:unnamed protein product, partial [Scytosiphon promiscuus]
MFVRRMPRGGSLTANFELWTSSVIRSSGCRGGQIGTGWSSSPPISQAAAAGRAHLTSGAAVGATTVRSLAHNSIRRRSGPVRAAHEQAQGGNTTAKSVGGVDGGSEEELFGDVSLALGEEVEDREGLSLPRGLDGEGAEDEEEE